MNETFDNNFCENFCESSLLLATPFPRIHQLKPTNWQRRNRKPAWEQNGDSRQLLDNWVPGELSQQVWYTLQLYSDTPSAFLLFLFLCFNYEPFPNESIYAD